MNAILLRREYIEGESFENLSDIEKYKTTINLWNV
jgi:hypothetical protein